MTRAEMVAYAIECARYAAVLAEASHAVGLRRDAAAYLAAESDRIIHYADSVRERAAEMAARSAR